MVRLYAFLVSRPTIKAVLNTRPLPQIWKGWDEQGVPLDFDQWPISKVIRGVPFKDQVLRARREDTGHEFYASYNGDTISDQNGKTVYGFIIIHDITERKKAEELSAFQTQLLSEVHDAVFSSDVYFRITYWNKAAERMFGWTKEEALGKISTELLQPLTESSTIEQTKSKLRKESYWEGEGQYKRKDGTYFIVDVSSTTLKDLEGKYSGQLIAARDITEHRKSERALKESEEKYRSLLNEMNKGFALIELMFDDQEKATDYIFLEVNHEYEENSGFNELKGKRRSDLPIKMDYELIDQYNHIAKTGNSRTF